VRRSLRFAAWAVIALGVLLAAGAEPATATEAAWKASFDSGVKARQQAKYADAERFLRDAVKQAEASNPQDDRLVQSLNELGTVLRWRGDPDEAQTCYQRALKIAEAAHGKDSPDVATSVFGLAVIADGRGKADDAERLFKRALVIREKALGPNTPDVARCLYGYANFKMNQQDFGQARSLLTRALTIFEKTPGDDPEYLALTLLSLGSIYEQQKKLAEASAAFDRAATEGAKVLPADHPTLASITLTLADFKLFRQKDVPGAIALYEHAIPIAAREEGADAEAVAASKVNLASAYIAQQRYADAERIYSESLPILEKSTEPDRWNLTDAVAKYEELKKYNAAQASGTAPKYETRYVNGTQFQIGTQGDLQVWMAVWKGEGLQAMLYVVNDSDQPITFFPEQIAVDAVRKGRSGPRDQRLKTYSAEQYEQKIRNHNANAQLLAALGTFAKALNTPEGETYRTEGNYDIRNQYGTRVGSASYSGTTTRLPSAANREASLDRARAEGEALRAQLETSYQAIAQNLMRTNTLDPNTYYGGMVYMNKSGKDYVMTVPFGDTSFQFSFRFDR
jgi:tetratricopeptide (TPR) repeat protein